MILPAPLLTLDKYSSLSAGHYELCHDDIGDLLAPIISDLRENANEIG